MTKKQAERYAYLLRALDNLGVTKEDADALLRIERTLHRWAERECGDESGTAIERDEATDIPYLTWDRGDGKRGRCRTADREKGAFRRLAAIMARYPALAAYHQTDPRGCALFVYKRERMETLTSEAQRMRLDPPSIDSCYSSVGVAVCYT